MSNDKSEKRIEQMENELKMLKNEVKLGVTSVHDYLLNIKDSTGNDLDSLGPDEETTMNLRGGIEMADKKNIPAVLPKSGSSQGGRKSQTPDKETLTELENREHVDNNSQEEPRPAQPPPKEDRRDISVYTTQPAYVWKQDIQVNTLANLISWVSVVKQRLGSEQLPVILDVYGMCNELSPKTKKIILRLADLVTEQPVQESNADIWSQLILQLHGILMGSVSVEGSQEKPAGIEMPGIEEEKVNEGKSVNHEMPYKLKLVVPVGEYGSKELNIGEFNGKEIRD